MDTKLGMKVQIQGPIIFTDTYYALRDKVQSFCKIRSLELIQERREN